MFERIKASYVEKPDDTKLMEGAINGMISSLDPHSRYMNEKGWSDMQETTHGEFGGLGIEVTMEDGLVKVVTPIDDTPAAKAGILSGDVITQIDDEAVQGLSLEQAVSRMKGPANSKIRLKISRKGSAAPIDVAILREIIRVRPVRFHTDGGDIGYIRITRFNEQTTDGLKKAIAEHFEGDPAGQARGLCHRPPQQSGRIARPGGFGVERLHDARRGGLDARPYGGRNPALHRARRRHDQGQAARRADQRRIGFGFRDRGRRAARPQARHPDRDAHVRQGLGADHHSARAGQRRASR